MSKIKKGKKKIIVQAIKSESLEVEAFKEDSENYDEVGIYLDTKK